jgi:hypothetical protein
MEFRWMAAVAIWTLLVGPVFGPPIVSSTTDHSKNGAAVRPLRSSKIYSQKRTSVKSRAPAPLGS